MSPSKISIFCNDAAEVWSTCLTTSLGLNFVASSFITPRKVQWGKSSFKIPDALGYCARSNTRTKYSRKRTKEELNFIPDSTLERSRISFISWRTKSPEDNMTRMSCLCSLSSCVVERISAMLTTPDRGDLISCDMVASICFALIVSSERRWQGMWWMASIWRRKLKEIIASIMHYTCNMDGFVKFCFLGFLPSCFLAKLCHLLSFSHLSSYQKMKWLTRNWVKWKMGNNARERVKRAKL